MKKCTLTLLAMAALGAAHAQKDAAIGLHYPTQKGNVLIGGDVLLADANYGHSSDGTSYGPAYNIGLSPRAGYFLTDHLVGGAELNGSFGRFRDFHSSAIGAGVFARYYFGKSGNKDSSLNRLRLFAEGGISVNRGASYFDGSGRTAFSSLTPHATIGVNYFLSRNVALEGGLFYQHSTLYDHGRWSGNDSHLGVRVGLQIFLGK